MIARGSEATQSGVRAATSGGAARKDRLLGSIVDVELGKDADVGLLDVWQPAGILIAFALVLVTVSVKRFSKTME